MKHLGYLIAGIVFTVLFFILSCSDSFNIYEMLYYAPGYSDQMHNLSTYPVISIITILVAWGGAAVYYFAINSVKFDRWYHWLAILAVVVVLTPTVCYLYNNSVFTGYGLEYSREALMLELFTVLFAALLYIVASFSMRWWSSNCRHTPIPQ